MYLLSKFYPSITSPFSLLCPTMANNGQTLSEVLKSFSLGITNLPSPLDSSRAYSSGSSQYSLSSPLSLNHAWSDGIR